MKTLLMLIFVLTTSVARADFVLLYNKTTGEVINVADKETDFNIATTDKIKLEVKEMSGDFTDLELEAPLQDYKLVNGKLVLNTKKISDRENEKIDQEALEAQRQVDLGTAKTKLINLGLTAQECQAFLR